MSVQLGGKKISISNKAAPNIYASFRVQELVIPEPFPQDWFGQQKALCATQTSLSQGNQLLKPRGSERAMLHHLQPPCPAPAQMPAGVTRTRHWREASHTQLLPWHWSLMRCVNHPPPNLLTTSPTKPSLGLNSPAVQMVSVAVTREALNLFFFFFLAEAARQNSGLSAIFLSLFSFPVWLVGGEMPGWGESQR